MSILSNFFGRIFGRGGKQGGGTPSGSENTSSSSGTSSSGTGSSNTPTQIDTVAAKASLDPVALAVELPASLSSKVKSSDELLSADKINTRSLQTWNPFLYGGATDYAPLINPQLVNGKITGGRYEKPNELFDAKTIVPVKMILEGFARTRPEIQPLVDAVLPAKLLRRPAHKFNVGGKLDTRVVMFGGREAADPGHTHIDGIVHELGKKHMRVIVQWSHPADYSLSQSTQGGTPADILGNQYMPAGSSHINLFSTGMIGGKPVVVTSNWGDDSIIGDMWPGLAVHLLAIDYQAGVEDPVPEETLAAWKHNADMWDCFAAMLVPFAGDDPFGYTKYQWNPLEVHDQATAVAVATELANLDWDTFKKKYGAFYCAEAQYSVANWGPQEATQLKMSRFGTTRIGRIIKTFGEAPGYAGKDIAWKRAHPEIGWKWLTERGKDNGGISLDEYARLAFPKPNDSNKVFKEVTYSNRQGIHLEFVPESIKGWQSYRPRNRDGLIASPLSAATTAWSLVRSYLPRQKIAETIADEILRAYKSGGPNVQGVVKGLTGGVDPEGPIGQVALGLIAGALAGNFLVAALNDDSNLDSEFKRDPATGQVTADKSKWTYVSSAQQTMLEKAGYKELTSADDKAKVKKLWDDFLAVLTHPDNSTQDKLDAAFLKADLDAKSLRVRREPLVAGAPAYDGLMCFVPPGCWAMWAQQPFYSEAFSVRYVATCVHKSLAKVAVS